MKMPGQPPHFGSSEERMYFALVSQLCFCSQAPIQPGCRLSISSAGLLASESSRGVRSQQHGFLLASYSTFTRAIFLLNPRYHQVALWNAVRLFNTYHQT